MQILATERKRVGGGINLVIIVLPPLPNTLVCLIIRAHTELELEKRRKTHLALGKNELDSENDTRIVDSVHKTIKFARFFYLKQNRENHRCEK